MKHENATIVPESFIGLLYEDGAFVRTLNPGRHSFEVGWWTRMWSGLQVQREIKLIDMRERSLTIKGQEILTADKVAIRVSLLVYFRVQNAESAMHNVSSYEERIYEDVQLAARRFLASRDLDAILSDRNEISDAVRIDVSGAASSYGVEILRADVKDLVFPGNLREIMNQVLETERRAEAKLIEARKDAEAKQVKSQAEHQAMLQQLEAERIQVRISAEAEQERARIHLQTEIEQARVLTEHPILLRLRQIEALQEMAKGGGKFVIGFRDDELSSVFERDS
ncbi:slipin family protein [Acaryochloris marina NIES-2412]|uniref:slipin family protein n=1 Tax=Acaryochloris marina TaxID=155978 RepID=UPI0040580BD3